MSAKGRVGVCIHVQHSLQSLTPSVFMHIDVEKRSTDVYKIWHLRMLKAEFTSLLTFGLYRDRHHGHYARRLLYTRHVQKETELFK